VAHDRLLEVGKHLDNQAQGALSERWFKARYHILRRELKTFRHVKVDMERLLGARRKGTGRPASRFIDEIAEDGMVWEVKSGQGRLDAREKRQFADYQEMVKHKAKVKPEGSDKAIEVKRIHYVFTNPEGAKKNLVDMWKEVRAGKVRLTVIRDGEPLTLDLEWLGKLGVDGPTDFKKVLRWLDRKVKFPGEGAPKGKRPQWFRSAENRPRQPARTRLAVRDQDSDGPASPDPATSDRQEA